jgi:hypothetical protein
MHDAFSVKKQSALILHFFEHVISWVRAKLASSTEMIAFHLRVVSLNPTFITTNDGGDEEGIIFGLLLMPRAHGKMCYFLSFLSSLHTDFAALCCMWNSYDRIADTLHTTV